MSTFSGGIARVATSLISQVSLTNITRTQRSLLDTNTQLSTGRRITRLGDDPVAASTVSRVDARREVADQRVRNLNVADSSLSLLDTTMGEISSLVNEAISLGSSQISTGTSSAERSRQAEVVTSMINSLYNLGNSEGVIGYLFGGSNPGKVPFTIASQGFRYSNEPDPLFTDIGINRSVPVTLGANNVVGDLTSSVQGFVDLDPTLQADNRVIDVTGARGLPIQLGTVRMQFTDLVAGAQAAVSVDLTGADTIDDVTDAITKAVRDYETQTGLTILGPGGVAISGNSIAIDIPSGDLTFSDIPGGFTGQDLGLIDATGGTFNDVRGTGAALDPKVTLRTRVADLAGLAGVTLDTLRVRNNGGQSVVDLAGAATVADIKTLIEGTQLGVRVVINEAGTGINVLNEISSGSGTGLAIEEVADGANIRTAEALGIRSFANSTAVNVFNAGRGVRVVSGVSNPLTGAIDPTLNTDFRITMGDGFTIDVDISPADLTTSGNLLTALNNQISAALTAAGRPTTDLVALKSDGPNGLVFAQDPLITTGPVQVTQLNNSHAAYDLGLTDASWNAATNALEGVDVAQRRPDNLFSNLIDLRNALASNDVDGIQIATSRLEGNLDTLVQSQALVGGFSRRVEDEASRLQGVDVLEQTLRSGLLDLDYAGASARFSLLQTQLQAGLQTTAVSSQLSLLDFL